MSNVYTLTVKDDKQYAQYNLNQLEMYIDELQKMKEYVHTELKKVYNIYKEKVEEVQLQEKVSTMSKNEKEKLLHILQLDTILTDEMVNVTL